MAIEFQGATPNDGDLARQLLTLQASPALSFTAAQVVANQNLAYGLTNPRLTDIPYIASGLTLPGSGALTASIASGDATINGIRVIMGAVAPGFTASKDNYVDLVYSSSTYAGSYVVTPVTIAAAAPAVPANALRLGFVTTGASTITSQTTNAKDSLGNWMSNLTPKASCILQGLTSQTVANGATVTFAASTEILDNLSMHSGSVNSSRITIQQAGLYDVGFDISLNAALVAFAYGQIFKNGSSPSNPFQWVSSAGGYKFVASAQMFLVAGDYLEVGLNGSTQLSAANFWALKR